jgi:polyisoprenoid-binding protein YceI
LEEERMRKSLRRAAAAALAVVALSSPASWTTDAAAHGRILTFDFEDPKGVNTISFFVDSDLEPISGTCSGVTGNVIFNPSHPELIRGRVTIEAKNLHVQNSKMNEALLSADWMDAERYPYIEFILTRARDVVLEQENVFAFTAVGNLTCRDITKEITAPVTLTYLPGKLAERVSGEEGDLVVMRTEVSLNRLDYGINPDFPSAIVGEKIELHLALAGAVPRPADATSP